MRVVFLGNHTVGVRTLATIAKTEEVAGVVVHPPDPEDGVRYLSVHDFAIASGWRVHRSRAKDGALTEFIQSVSPDLLWIADFRYLLPPHLMTVPRLGIVNLHPSLLPKYRGRAPLNWAILNGESKLGLTAHFVDAGMDSGDVIDQASFDLRLDQDVGDALEILYPLYERLTASVLSYFDSGRVPRVPQNHGDATCFPRRKPQDGLIDWSRPVDEVWNLIRAVAAPYPGGFTYWKSGRLVIWKAQPSPCPMLRPQVPGTILHTDRDSIDVCCRDRALRLLRYELEQDIHPPTIGEVLG